MLLSILLFLAKLLTLWQSCPHMFDLAKDHLLQPIRLTMTEPSTKEYQNNPSYRHVRNCKLADSNSVAAASYISTIFICLCNFCADKVKLVQLRGGIFICFATCANEVDSYNRPLKIFLVRNYSLTSIHSGRGYNTNQFNCKEIPISIKAQHKVYHLYKQSYT